MQVWTQTRCPQRRLLASCQGNRLTAKPEARCKQPLLGWERRKLVCWYASQGHVFLPSPPCHSHLWPMYHLGLWHLYVGSRIKTLFKSCQAFPATIYQRQADYSTHMAKIPPQAFTLHPKDCNSFSLSITNATGNTSCRSHGCTFSFLHHTKHQLLLLTRMAPHNIVSTLLVFDPLFQIGNKAAHMLFCLPSWHSSYWGTGTPSNICKAPTLFSSQIKSFFSVLLPKEKNPPLLYVPFHKSCLFTILL